MYGIIVNYIVYLNGPFCGFIVGKFTIYEVEYSEFMIHSGLLSESNSTTGSERDVGKIMATTLL